MFKFFKKKAEARRIDREFRAFMEKRDREQARNIALTPDEFLALPEDDLYNAVLDRTFHAMEGWEDDREGLATLTEAARAFYVCILYESEVCNGGLCQFLDNSSRLLTPYVSESLTRIGAEEHRKLFDDFLSATHLAMDTLVDGESVFNQVSDQAFDDFDQRFYDLGPLLPLLDAYVRANKTAFDHRD